MPIPASKYSMDPFTAIFFLIIFINVFAVIWLLVRKFQLWYWKIDEIVDLLKDIRANTALETHPIKDPLPAKKQASSTPEHGQLWELLHKEIKLRK